MPLRDCSARRNDTVPQNGFGDFANPRVTVGRSKIGNPENGRSTSKPGKVPPFKSLDILRGLAALWVVMCHAADHYVGGTRWEKWPVYSFSLRGQLGVVLFFLISGYCIVGAGYSAFVSGKTVRRYAFERIRRIYPPYFFAIVLALLYAGCVNVAQRFHLIHLIHHPLEVHGGALFWVSNLLIFQLEARQPYINIVLWSLCYEVAFYAVVGLILIITKRIAVLWGTPTGFFFFSLSIGGLTIASLAWQIVTGNSGMFPIDRWYQFGLGGLFFLVAEIRSSIFVGYRSRICLINRTMMATAVLLTGVFAYLRSLGGGDLNHPSSRPQCAAALLYLAIFSILRAAEKRWVQLRILSPLFWLGSFSYSLYLVHPYFLALVDVPARSLGFVGNWYLVSWMLQIAVSVVAGWAFYVLVERHFVSSRQRKRIADELVGVTHAET